MLASDAPPAVAGGGSGWDRSSGSRPQIDRVLPDGLDEAGALRDVPDAQRAPLGDGHVVAQGRLEAAPAAGATRRDHRRVIQDRAVPGEEGDPELGFPDVR